MSNSISTGINLTGILAMIFTTLKLNGAIDWSWWWVLSPLWISIVLTIAPILGVALLVKTKTSKSKRIL